jgi:hypothetical protein
MPRIRSIRPETWGDPTFCRLTPLARLLYIALWGYVDDAGRGRWQPKTIEGYAFPTDRLDDYGTSIEGLLGELTQFGRVVRYHDEGTGDLFFCIPTFCRHQHPTKPLPSRLPAPPAKATATKALAATQPKPKPAVPKTRTVPDTPVIKLLSAHFGEPTQRATLNLYFKFLHHTLVAGGWQDDDDGAAETERRIFNMKAAHHDNTRAWTLTNLIGKWDHWGIDRQPVSTKQVTRHVQRQRTQAALRHIDPASQP